MSRTRPITLQAAGELWLEHAAAADLLRPTTLVRYREVLLRHLAPLGGETVDHVKEREVRRLRIQLERQVGPSTLNQCRAVLRGVVRFLRGHAGYDGPDISQWWDHATQPPARHVDVYSPAEIEQIAEAAECLRDATLIRMAGYAGLRVSELRGLRWRDVDLQSARIIVHVGYTRAGGDGTTKGKRERAVPIVPQLALPLAMLKAETGGNPEERVFTELGGAVLDEFAVRRRFRVACERAQIRALRPHDLRHSAVSLMVQVFPLTDVQAYAGHSNILTTMKYVHHQSQNDAAQRFGALLEGRM